MDKINSFKNELQNIIFGDDGHGKGGLIKAAQIILKSIQNTSADIETKLRSKPEEERTLAQFATERNLWLTDSFLGNYITEGAEQKVYFKEGVDFVIKINNGIFYASWLDYFNNLLLHNAFFPNTTYTLAGFIKKGNDFFVVVTQPLVIAIGQANLENVREFMAANGFINKKNNDYYHPDLGIIIEDLHDENVLANAGVLFFVDTVFYITETFANNRIQ